MRGVLTRGRIAGAAVVGVLVGVGAWYFGAEWGYGVLVGAAAAAGVAAWAAAPQPEHPIWPRPEATMPPGGRDDVLMLSWVLTARRGRVQLRAVQRVRGIAAERLARRGLELDAASDRPAVVALLGERAYATLHSTVNDTITQTALLGCIDAVDALGRKEHA
ncbi:hypothetical protein [Gryllotalpicola ginsengisoli]|uniref:hypothetical protein n=1 Tax=Gryllotalpicola ginsengisoli TaxID=444608 RepID=UPI0003FFC845|nr:hypothetical protein [Gryllotalpicola ginsengisoli]